MWMTFVSRSFFLQFIHDPSNFDLFITLCAHEWERVSLIIMSKLIASARDMSGNIKKFMRMNGDDDDKKNASIDIITKNTWAFRWIEELMCEYLMKRFFGNGIRISMRGGGWGMKRRFDGWKVFLVNYY